MLAYQVSFLIEQLTEAKKIIDTVETQISNADNLSDIKKELRDPLTKGWQEVNSAIEKLKSLEASKPGEKNKDLQSRTDEGESK